MKDDVFEPTFVALFNSGQVQEYFQAQYEEWMQSATYYRGTIRIGIMLFEAYEICDRQRELMQDYLMVHNIKVYKAKLHIDL